MRGRGAGEAVSPPPSQVLTVQRGERKGGGRREGVVQGARVGPGMMVRLQGWLTKIKTDPLETTVSPDHACCFLFINIIARALILYNSLK